MRDAKAKEAAAAIMLSDLTCGQCIFCHVIIPRQMGLCRCGPSTSLVVNFGVEETMVTAPGPQKQGRPMADIKSTYPPVPLNQAACGEFYPRPKEVPN